ncbi:MAG: tetratricopeptide repeat protein [Alphaproteobacteria bacterium]|nr:tetratricopeptide repeat protein [Alphaproteobacteria bacterium]
MRRQLESHSEKLQHATRLHREGRLKAALARYKSILKQDPRNFDALFFCAMAQVQSDRPQDAKRSLDRALKIRPRDLGALNALGNVLRALGRQEQAVNSYQATIAESDDHFEALYNLGNTLVELGRFDEAVEPLARSVAVKPDWTEACLSLANAQTLAGDWEGALASLDRVQGTAAAADVDYLRGNVFKQMDRFDEAVVSYRDAISLRPDFVEALVDLGVCLVALAAYSDAIDCYQTALARMPNSPIIFNNMGTAQAAMGHHEKAVENFRKALAADPGYVEAHFNLALSLIALGDHEEAIRCHKQALKIDPEKAKAGNNLAHLFLSLQRFREGWHYYEHRFRAVEKLEYLQGILAFDSPPGSIEGDLVGKKVLVRAEQGLGDEIMFASMVPDLRQAAATVILAVEPRLVGLLQRSFPECSVISYAGEDEHLYEFVDVDRRFYAGSLGQLFRNETTDFPGLPYLVADDERRRKYRADLDELGSGRKIGIMWRGGVGGPREELRSLSLEDFMPLLADDVHWISLNHLPTAKEQCRKLSETSGKTVHQWDHILRSDNFDDTAALIAELDTVISVTCTAAHCAAALGVDTHVLVNRRPEWRYGSMSATMVWYNSMTLYRQSDDWPLDRIARALGLVND